MTSNQNGGNYEKKQSFDSVGESISCVGAEEGHFHFLGTKCIKLRDFLTYIYKRILSPLNNDLTGFTLLCSLVALANLTVAKCHQSLIEGCAGLRGLLTYSRSFRSHS